MTKEGKAPKWAMAPIEQLLEDLERESRFRVQPFVNLDRLEYLQIVDFNPIDTPRSGPRDAAVTNETEGPGK